MKLLTGATNQSFIFEVNMKEHTHTSKQTEILEKCK